MLHSPVAAYVLGVAASVTAIEAAQQSLSIGGVIALAIGAPLVPVVVGYLLTHRKLVAQDAKVQEIHVLVNSQLSTTLAALQEALLEGIRLKGELGEPLSPIERQVADLPEGEPLPAGIILAADIDGAPKT
jgi:hypothetical protein